MGDVTRILQAIEEGVPHATDELLNVVYAELRELAAAKLAHERPGQTLQATAVVHETFLRLFGGGSAETTGCEGEKRRNVWQSRGHFFAAAAEAMRRILVEQARRKRRIKRGGDRARLDLEAAELAVEPVSDEILALDEALERLAAMDKAKAEVVKLRYFAGLSIEDTAAALRR